MMAMEHPLGIGPLVFGKIFFEDTHNIWLKALLDYGWLGFASWLTMIVWTIAGGFRILFRDRPWQPYLLCAYVVFLGHVGLGSVIDTDHWRHLYLLIGLIWGCMGLEVRHQRVCKLPPTGQRHSAACRGQQPAQRQPRVSARCDAADVAGPDQQPVARHLGLGGVVAQRAEEERRHSQQHHRRLRPDFVPRNTLSTPIRRTDRHSGHIANTESPGEKMFMNRARNRVALTALTALAAVGLAGAPAAAATTGVGDLYYTDFSGHGVTRWAGSGELESLPGDASGYDSQLNANVSPNGQWLSWVDTNNNTLHVVNTHTGDTKLVRNHVDGVCAPSWSPDNRRLLMVDVTSGPDFFRLGVLDITTGQYTRLPNAIQACHPFWSADGRSIAYWAGAGQIFVANTDGSNIREVPGLGGTGPYAAGLVSVSPRADRVIVKWFAEGPGSGEAYRWLAGATVLDVRTGKKIAIPVRGELIKAQFRKDGSMLVRVKGDKHNQLVLVSAAGSIVKRVDEPAELKEKVLLTV